MYNSSLNNKIISSDSALLIDHSFKRKDSKVPYIASDSAVSRIEMERPKANGLVMVNMGEEYLDSDEYMKSFLNSLKWHKDENAVINVALCLGAQVSD